MQLIDADTKIVYMFREQNKVTNAMAEAGVQQENFDDSDFLELLPKCARIHLQVDIIGTC